MKNNKILYPLLAVAALVIATLACGSDSTGQKVVESGTIPTSAPSIAIPTSTPEPTEVPPLVINAGELSAHKDEITRDRVVNVYKKDGTLDQREDDLKELCLDWFYYRQKIFDYQAQGEQDKVVDAQSAFNDINLWLTTYDDDDAQTMLILIQEKGWH